MFIDLQLESRVDIIFLKKRGSADNKIVHGRKIRKLDEVAVPLILERFSQSWITPK